MSEQFTPYPDVNAILLQHLTAIQSILADNFVGMYLYGSLTTDDFDSESSDIDYLVVTHEEVRGDTLDALVAMHAHFGKLDSKWAIQIEASYIPMGALRRYNINDRHHPHIDRGGSVLAVEPHEMDWIIQRYVLLDRGVILKGPPLDTLIDPISTDTLKQANRDLLDFWWEPMLSDTSIFERSGAGYLPYAIMTMCRILYTLEHGTVISKPEAAQWALQNLDDPLVKLVDLAVKHRNGTDLIRIQDAQSMIRYTVEKAFQSKKGKIAP